jgi:hypothetical protein
MQVRSPEFGEPERVSFEKTVLITLRYLGHAGNIRLISDLFNVSDFTAVTCRNRVISALGSLKDEYICWPLDAPSQANVSTKFQEKKDFHELSVLLMAHTYKFTHLRSMARVMSTGKTIIA